MMRSWKNNPKIMHIHYNGMIDIQFNSNVSHNDTIVYILDNNITKLKVMEIVSKIVGYEN